MIGDYALLDVRKPDYRRSKTPRGVLGGGSISRLKLLALATMLSVSGCSNIEAPDAGCEWIRPIILAEDDRLTIPTVMSILAHNEAAAEFCQN